MRYSILTLLPALSLANPVHIKTQITIPNVFDTPSCKAPMETLPCLRVLFPGKPPCPENMCAAQYPPGDSNSPWTCCIEQSNTAAKTPETPHEHIDTQICLRVCWLEQPTCPEGWYSEKYGDCYTCCKSPESVAKVPEPVPEPPQEKINTQLCLRVCWLEQPTCPEGWYSEKYGDCYTCCKSPDSVAKVSKAPEPPQELVDNEICWKVCFPEEITCPEGWYSKSFGDCHTCCRAYDPSVKVSKAPEPLQEQGDNDICLRVCWFEEPTCPEGWYSKKFGDCYTCCKSSSSVAKDAKVAKVPELPQEHIDGYVCMRACWTERPDCPEGWFVERYGDCYTCCKSDNSVSRKKWFWEL